VIYVTEQCTALNESKEKSQKENNARKNLLSRQLQKVEAQRAQEVEALMHQMDAAIK